MKLYNLESTQKNVAEDLLSAYEGGFLPQSLLFSGPRGSSRLTGALDLSFLLLDKMEDRELLSTGNIAFFPHREFYGKLSSAISMFERERTSSSRVFLIETVRQILFQYHSSVSGTSPSTMSSLFALASDTDALLLEYEKDKDYTEKEVNALTSFLKSKVLDPKFL
ncbi:MAG: hypothetical protein KBS81_04700, partial [Spirochaetales bacterium]|nr:hypothetical protein [Candidatus Physcosoma equi]